jgi:hypothetical protein
MRLEVEDKNYNEAFFAKQYTMLQMDKRASRGAWLHFTNKACTHRIHVNHVHDLSVAALADPGGLQPPPVGQNSREQLFRAQCSPVQNSPLNPILIFSFEYSVIRL